MYWVSYTSVREMQNEYNKRIQDWECQRKYERNIVRSVPERAIVACSIILDNDERWDPG